MLDILRWLDGVSTSTGFILYGFSLTSLMHPLWDILEVAAPSCRSPPNVRRKSHCTDTIDFLNRNFSTQNMRCSMDQRSDAQWIQSHTKPNYRYQHPLRQLTQAVLPNRNDSIKCRNLQLAKTLSTQHENNEGVTSPSSPSASVANLFPTKLYIFVQNASITLNIVTPNLA